MNNLTVNNPLNNDEAEPAAISVQGLTKTWPGGVVAVRGIDFEVAPGQVFGLLGPNGAGKSTTIGMLTTTVVPTAGRACIHGHDVVTEPISARSASAVVFQDAVIDKALTGRRNLDVHARLWGVPPDLVAARIRQLAGEFGIDDIVDRPVATYSGGQRRRLEIARSLLSDPHVLFLDEPTVGLDPRIRYELLDLIAGLRARSGMTVLLTTHYLDEAERLCDRVAIMHAGAIVALDSPANLLAGMGHELVEVRVEGDPTAALAALRSEGIAGADAFAVGATITVPVHDRAARDVAAALAHVEIDTTAMGTRPPTLDDVYLRLTGDRLAA
jgi:ABC-2 type transport system ATP-binding protein